MNSRSYLASATTAMIAKCGIWLTLPPLILSFTLMDYLPDAFRGDHFNLGVSSLLLGVENTVRVGVFAMPVSFVVGVSRPIQKRGLVLYLLGVLIYGLSYGALIMFPDSPWSTSRLGFTAPAYSNLIWMTGLGCMGEALIFFDRIRYRPRMFVIPSILFVVVHAAHAVVVFHREFG